MPDDESDYCPLTTGVVALFWRLVPMTYAFHLMLSLAVFWSAR